MLNRKLNSGIFLEAHLFVKLPISDPLQQCRLDYKMKYSTFESFWTENKASDGLEHLSNNIQFEYIF